jgi:hypothetical protein
MREVEPLLNNLLDHLGLERAEQVALRARSAGQPASPAGL